MLSGAWIGDDEALYYISEAAGIMWWAGVSVDSPLGANEFHVGLRFANIFRGRLAGSSIVGEWADTPRGDVPQDGTMDLAVVSGDEIRRLRGTGNFGGSVWRRVNVPAARVAVGDRPYVYKETVLVYGTVIRNLAVDLDGQAGDDRGLSFVVQVDRTGAGDTLRAELDRQPGFWSTGWLKDPEHVRAALDAQGNTVVCRILGRDRQAQEATAPYPGWSQRDGNSVLFLNGRPINGYVETHQDGSARIFNRDLPPGTRVRITGLLTLMPDRSTDAAREGIGRHVAICPVSAVDIVAPTARGTLTGIWGGDDLGTYYLRQVGNRLWWLGTSPDRGRFFATVFAGLVTPNGTGIVVRGEYADVPMGTAQGAGRLNLRSTDLVTLHAVDDSGGYRARRWEKISDNV